MKKLGKNSTGWKTSLTPFRKKTKNPRHATEIPRGSLRRPSDHPKRITTVVKLPKAPRFRAAVVKA